MRRLRLDADLTQEELARELRLATGTISRWENGHANLEDPRAKRVLALYARRFGVTPDWLLGKTDERQPEPTSTEPTYAGHDRPQDVDTVHVPYLATIPAGSMADVEEMADETYPVLKHLAEPDTYVIRVHGDSMYPELQDGDLVLMRHCRISDPAQVEGRVCAVVLEGEATLKRIRFQRRNGHRHLVLSADNARQYPPILLDENEEVRIVGVALDIVRRRL